MIVNKLKTIVKNSLRLVAKKTTALLKKFPIVITVLICFILMILIIVGEEIRARNATVVVPEKIAKNTTVFRIGESARIEVLGTVKNNNIIHVYAQTAGVVQKVYVKEGQEIKRGKQLIYISSNYQGANAQAVQRQIAQKNYQNIVDTLDQQKESIDKQIELAKQVDSNSDELAQISKKSIDGLKNQLNLNGELLSAVEENLESLNAATPSAENKALIATAKSSKAQLLAAESQLKTNIDNLQYSTNPEKPPTNISNLQRDIAISQLELTKKNLDLNREISQLQLRLAQINESLSYPSSFCEGTVQKVHVKPGDVVNPGQLIATISGKEQSLSIEAQVSKYVANNYSRVEDSIIQTDLGVINLKPSFVSSEATDGSLYSMIFHLDGESTNLPNLADNQAVSISLPIGQADSLSSIILVPIDSVTKTNQGAFLFVAENNQAKIRQVKLGTVYGQFVIIDDGLGKGDIVINNRAVVDGDKIVIHEK
ncbi:MAG: efflux RND transporter periplasmic adaptor subunit [Patescibacteria group bacterium]